EEDERNKIPSKFFRGTGGSTGSRTRPTQPPPPHLPSGIWAGNTSPVRVPPFQIQSMLSTEPPADDSHRRYVRLQDGAGSPHDVPHVENWTLQGAVTNSEDKKSKDKKKKDEGCRSRPRFYIYE